MIELSAVITAVDGDHVIVEAANQGCGRCHEPGGCGGVSLGTMLCASPRRLRLPNSATDPLRVGERVDVGVADGILRHGAMATYGSPLLGLFIGAATGNPFGEVWAMCGGLAGLVLAWLAAARYRRRVEHRAGHLVIVRRYPAL